ncbi:hypothetical protein MTO96_045360 [Rhipicephalus appendiculatus]
MAALSLVGGAQVRSDDSSEEQPMTLPPAEPRELREGRSAVLATGGILADATEGVIRRCIVDTIPSRVAPVLADVLRTIPFPTFANEQE